METDLKKIRKEMQYRFGEDMQYNIRIVDNIEKEKSGKYSLIKNKLTEQ